MRKANHTSEEAQRVLTAGNRLGNEISDRQWSDILGVLRTQSGRLDENYLNHWAGEIGVAYARVAMTLPLAS